MSITYNRASASNVGTGGANTRQDNAAEAAISNLLQHLESVLEGKHVCRVG